MFCLATEDTQEYEVTGIAQGDTLSVRQRASASSALIARLANGTAGVSIIGGRVLNGSDDWVHISGSDFDGWVRPKYLRPVGGNPEGASARRGDSGQSASATSRIPAISKDATTLAAWQRYNDCMEKERSHAAPDPKPTLDTLLTINVDGADPTIARHIADTVAVYKTLVELQPKVEGVNTEAAQRRAAVESVRPGIRAFGRDMLPRTGAPERVRQDIGEGIAELLAELAASTNVDPALKVTLRRAVDSVDRLFKQEYAINVSLGLEQPPRLAAVLNDVKRRDNLNRLLSGHWIVRDPGHQDAEVTYTVREDFRRLGGAFPTFHWHGRFGDQTLYWQFGDGDDIYVKFVGDEHTAEKFRGVFVTSNIFRIINVGKGHLSDFYLGGDKVGNYFEIDKISQ